MNDPVSVFILNLGDLLLGWILHLPRDLGLAAVALLTAALLVVVRRWTTDQERLKRVKQDQRILSQTIARAKEKGDRDDLARIKSLKTRIGMIKLRAEIKPLLWAIVPVAFLAAWAYVRLPYLAPEPGQPIEVRLLHPVSAIDQLTHLVPAAGIEAAQPVTHFREHADYPGQAVASWLIRLPEYDGDNAPLASLVLVSSRGRFTHELESPPRPPPVLVPHDAEGVVASELILPERRLFGLVPGIPFLGLPAWLTGYLLIVIAGIPITKRLFKLQ